jgi:glutaredoxin
MNASKYIAVFATTTLIFMIGLLIGSYTTGQKLKHVNELEQDLRMDTMAMELQYLFLSQEPCQTDTELLTEELYEIGEKLSYMENSLGSDNAQVMQLKEYYSLLEIRHWLFLKQVTKECDTNLTLILFFYSQEEKDCPKCVEQGYALTFLRKEFQDVRVYSFDVNMTNPALDVIKKSYIHSNTEMPVIVIDNKPFYGFMDKEQLKQELGLSTLKISVD